MKVLIEAEEIREAVEVLGQRLATDYAGKTLTVVGVLTGSVMLLADLVRAMNLPLRISLIRASSYRGSATRGGELEVDEQLLDDVEGRDVLLVDDIFDSGRTPLEWLHQVVAGWLKTEWDTRPAGLAVSGVRLGAQAALGLAYRHARDYPVVAAVAPAVDFHKLHGLGLPLDDWYNSPEDARQHTVPLHINPLNWPVHQLLCCDSDDHEWFDGVQRLTSKLHSSGIPVTTLFESHQLGHCWDYFNIAANHVIDFVTQRLQQVHKSL